MRCQHRRKTLADINENPENVIEQWAVLAAVVPMKVDTPRQPRHCTAANQQ